MRNLVSLFAFGACVLLARGHGAANIPLNERVMVVYNAAGDDSHRVAKYYMEKRGIPKANICKIDTDLAWMEDGTKFEPEIKKPLRACLEKLGKQQILYIVFSFQMPYAVLFDGHEQAVDQLVSDIWDEYAGPRILGRQTADQPYFGKAESQGNVYEPYVPFAKYREQPNAKTIYSVWRLDGATAEVAKGLVDKALYAESNGLQGKAYFDIQGPIANYADKGYGAGEWDIYQASQMAKRAGFETTLDEKPTEFGTAPSLLRCENAALYAGWYSLAHYNDAFSWAPGAIGFHLDSASATNPRAPSNWVAGALQRGITVTSGSVTEPYLEGLVHPDQIFLYLFQGANVGDAVLRGTRWLKWMIVNLGDPLYTPFPKGAGAYGATPHQESWFGISPNNLVGGGSVRAQFVLAEKRDKTVPVTFKANYPALVTLPTNVAIPPTATGAQFQIAVKPPDEALSITITVIAGTETISNTLNVYPILADLTLSEPGMKSDGTVTGTVTLMVPAKQGGFNVKLSSSLPEVVVPEDVTVPVGATKATFPVSGRPVRAEVTATISAKFDNASKTAQLKITP
jgi:uncharacterized protein (TIGR03790 family)